MSSIYLFNIASQQSHWLAVRQETVTGNIAHANTPGYAARDVQPFEAVLQSSHLAMATSDPAHVADTTAGCRNVLKRRKRTTGRPTDSGNTVSVEKELIKAGEVNRAFAEYQRGQGVPSNAARQRKGITRGRSAQVSQGIAASGLEAQSHRMRVVPRTWRTRIRPARRPAPIHIPARPSASTTNWMKRWASTW